MPTRHIQPERYAELLRDKTARHQQLFAPLTWLQAEIHPSPPLHFRMRAEFRLWHHGDRLDYAMFDPAEPKTPIAIEAFPIAAEPICQLMPVLRRRLEASPTLRRQLFQAEFLATTSGEVLVTLIYHRPLDETWEHAARELQQALGITLIGRARGQRLCLGNDFVTESLQLDGRTYHFRQPEGGFTQPNAAVNTAMIEWARRSAAGIGGDLLELYCGNGNFTLPLAELYGRVLATEISKTSIAAARANCELNDVRNIDFVRMSSEEFTAALNRERPFRRLQEIDLDGYRFSTVLVDPPRAGLDKGTERLVQRFDNILYISCNPHTLLANLATICQTHTIEKLAFFDQFPYTDHLECGVLLERRER